MKKFTLLAVILIFFYTLAVVLWQTMGEIFFLYNFLIIGTSIGLGVGLWPVFPKNKRFVARLISQFLVGGYMFFGLGCGLIYLIFGYVMPENMQIEGFWFWLLSGVFMAGVIHYAVAKILGPLIFGRAWCGWACWTAAVLDTLPWKYNKLKRPTGWWNFRYMMFFLSTALVFTLFFAFDYGVTDTVERLSVDGRSFSEVVVSLLRTPELWWFLGGNLLYYLVGVILAMTLKDNRAFCKYVCPVAVVMKVTSPYAMLKIDRTDEICTGCKICEKRCPMEVRIVDYTNSGRRVSSSECILCQNCINACPQRVLRLSFSLSGKSVIRK